METILSKGCLGKLKVSGARFRDQRPGDSCGSTVHRSPLSKTYYRELHTLRNGAALKALASIAASVSLKSWFHAAAYAGKVGSTQARTRKRLLRSLQLKSSKSTSDCLRLKTETCFLGECYRKLHALACRHATMCQVPRQHCVDKQEACIDFAYSEPTAHDRICLALVEVPTASFI